MAFLRTKRKQDVIKSLLVYLLLYFSHRVDCRILVKLLKVLAVQVEPVQNNSWASLVARSHYHVFNFGKKIFCHFVMLCLTNEG